MPPKGGARRGATTRRGKGTGRGRNTRVNDGGSQHGEQPEVQAERHEEEVQQPGNQNPPNPLMTDFVAALAAHNLVAQPPRANPIDRAAEGAKEFRRMDPPKFDGMLSDPLAADHWLSEIRELFESLDIEGDNLRVRLIACQLTGEAKEWWRSVRAGRRDARRAIRAVQGTDEPDIEDMTWAEFEEKFEDQYFPRSYRNQLKEQFERLDQGTTSVSEYAIRFQSLSRFAPHMVSTEEEKCRRFVKGLKPSIRRIVLGVEQERFAKAVEIARTLETDEEEQRGARRFESRPPNPTISAHSGGFANQNRKRMRDSFQPTPNRSNSRAPTSSGFGGNSSGSQRVCYQCGQPGHIRSQCNQPKPLPQPRVQNPGTCFGCGGVGHVSRVCPSKVNNRSESGSVQQPRQGQSFGRQPPRSNQSQPHFRQTTSAQGSRVERGSSSSTPAQTTSGRVFTISAATPQLHPTTQAPDTSVVRGTFLLFHSLAKVLFDSGASHSFIAASFVHALELEPEELSPPLFVDTPLGGRTLLDRVCRDCELVIWDRKFVFDFIVLGMTGFDLILGMDWLTTYRATIDCF